MLAAFLSKLVLGRAAPVQRAASVVWLFALVFGVAACGIGSSPSSTTIIGGVAATQSYPFFVSLTDGPETESFCGGSLVYSGADRGRAIVVTAAHCVVDASSKLSVRFQSQSGANPVVDIPVQRLIVHEGFEPTSLKNDLALLLLTKAAPEGAQEIDLATSQDLDSEGDQRRVIGRGNMTTIGWADASQLMEVDLPILAGEICSKSYDTFDHDVHLCAADPNGGKDSCQGDSGGPLFKVLDSGRFLLSGIVSYGTGCGQAKNPGVYTRLSAFQRWITAKQDLLRTPLYDLDSASYAKAFEQGCFSSTSVSLGERRDGGSVSEQRVMSLSGDFLELDKGRTTWLYHEILRGKIAASPSCVARMDDGSLLKFYWAQTPRDARRKQYRLLVRFEDEPGFTAVAPISFESNWDLFCASSENPDAALAWSVSLVGHEAELRLGEQLFRSAGLPAPAEKPNQTNSRAVKDCALGGGTKIELRVIESGPDAGRYVVSVSNLKGRRSGIDFQHVYSLVTQSERPGRQLLLGVETNDTGESDLVISNLSRDVLYGWRLSCDKPLQLLDVAGQPLQFKALGSNYVVDMLSSERPEFRVESQSTLRLALKGVQDLCSTGDVASASAGDALNSGACASAAPQSEGARAYCEINGFGTYLDLPSLQPAPAP
jgi:secreted trypsin-like serine protease